ALPQASSAALTAAGVLASAEEGRYGVWPGPGAAPTPHAAAQHRAAPRTAAVRNLTVIAALTVVPAKLAAAPRGRMLNSAHASASEAIASVGRVGQGRVVENAGEARALVDAVPLALSAAALVRDARARLLRFSTDERLATIGLLRRVRGLGAALRIRLGR